MLGIRLVPFARKLLELQCLNHGIRFPGSISLPHTVVRFPFFIACISYSLEDVVSKMKIAPHIFTMETLEETQD